MIKNIGVLLFIWLSIAFVSCKSDKGFEYIDSVHFVIKKYYKTGKVMVAQVFKKDTLGKAIPDGYYQEYYESGNNKVNLFYKNGLVDSIGKYFYDDGKISLITYNVKGIPYSKWIGYYPDGTIKNILFYDVYNRLIFEFHKRNYGDTIQGIPINLYSEKYELKRNENFRMLNRVINDANFKSVLNISILSPKGEIIDTLTVSTFNDIDGEDFYNYEGVFDGAPGTLTYIARIQLIDTTTGKILVNKEARRNIIITD